MLSLVAAVLVAQTYPVLQSSTVTSPGSTSLSVIGSGEVDVVYTQSGTATGSLVLTVTPTGPYGQSVGASVTHTESPATGSDTIALTGFVGTGVIVSWHLPNPTAVFNGVTITVIAKNVNASITSSQFLYGPANLPISVENVGDFDSLVPTNLNDQFWQQICNSTNPATGQTAAGPLSPGSPWNNAWATNPRDQTTTGDWAARFTAPPGTTSVTFTAWMTDGGATGSAVMGFVQGGGPSTPPTCGAPSTSLVVYPTNTQTQDSVSISPSLTTLNLAEIAINNAAWGTTGTAAPIIGTVQVKPVGATGLFASDFWRVAATPSNLWFNDRNEKFYYDYAFMSSPGAELVLDTDSPTIVVETENNQAGYTANCNPIVYVDGRYYTYVAMANGAPADYGQFITIALPPGMKRVEVETGQSVGGVQFTSVQNRNGSYVQAVYLPAASTSYLIPPAAPSGRVVEYGDSILSGQGTTVQPAALAQAPLEYLRRWFPGTIYEESWGGRSLFADIGDGGFGLSQPNMYAVIGQLEAAHPTDIWVQIGANDYFSGLGSAGYGGLLANFLDAAHTAIPAAQIWVQSLTITTVEANANDAGSLPAAYRTTQLATCAARPWCTPVDGTTMFPASYVSDTVHPYPDGYSLYGRGILAKMESQYTAAPGFSVGNFSGAVSASTVTATNLSTVAATTTAVTFSSYLIPESGTVYEHVNATDLNNGTAHVGTAWTKVGTVPFNGGTVPTVGPFSTSNYYTLPSGGPVNRASSTAFTVAMILSTISHSSVATPLATASYGANGFLLQDNLGTPGVWIGAGNSSITTATQAIADGVTTVLLFGVDGSGNCFVQANGGSIGSIASCTFTGGAGVTMLGQGNGGNVLNGYITELMMDNASPGASGVNFTPLYNSIAANINGSSTLQVPTGLQVGSAGTTLGAIVNGSCTMASATTCTVTDTGVAATSTIICAASGSTLPTAASFTGASITAGTSYTINASASNSDTWHCTRIN